MIRISPSASENKLSVDEINNYRCIWLWTILLIIIVSHFDTVNVNMIFIANSFFTGKLLESWHSQLKNTIFERRRCHWEMNSWAEHWKNLKKVGKIEKARRKSSNCLSKMHFFCSFYFLSSFCFYFCVCMYLLLNWRINTKSKKIDMRPSWRKWLEQRTAFFSAPDKHFCFIFSVS